MPYLGIWMKEKFMEVGSAGITASDMYRRGKVEPSRITKKKSTYESFRKIFYVLKTLGWVEYVGEEASLTKRVDGLGQADVLVPKIYYKLTEKGRQTSDEVWSDPMGALYPQWKAPRRAQRLKKRGAVPPSPPPAVPRKGRPTVARPAPLIQRAIAPVEVVRPIPTGRRPAGRRTPELASVRLQQQATALRPQVETLRALITPQRARVLLARTALDDLASKFAEILDQAEDELDKAQGVETQRLQAFIDTLSAASDAYDGALRAIGLLQAGIRTSGLNAWDEAMEKLLTCCPTETEQ